MKPSCFIVRFRIGSGTCTLSHRISDQLFTRFAVDDIPPNLAMVKVKPMHDNREPLSSSMEFVYENEHHFRLPAPTSVMSRKEVSDANATLACLESSSSKLVISTSSIIRLQSIQHSTNNMTTTAYLLPCPTSPSLDPKPIWLIGDTLESLYIGLAEEVPYVLVVYDDDNSHDHTKVEKPKQLNYIRSHTSDPIADDVFYSTNYSTFVSTMDELVRQYFPKPASFSYMSPFRESRWLDVLPPSRDTLNIKRGSIRMYLPGWHGKYYINVSHDVFQHFPYIHITNTAAYFLFSEPVPHANQTMQDGIMETIYMTLEWNGEKFVYLIHVAQKHRHLVCIS